MIQKSVISLIIFWVVFSLQSAKAVEEIININPKMGINYCAGNSTYTSRDNSYSLKIPNIGSKVFIEDKVISKGITYHATFSELNTGFIYIVSTKIREGLPKDESLLDRVSKKYVKYREQLGNDFRDRFTDGKFGRYYEFELKHAAGSFSSKFPYPIALGYKRSKEIGKMNQFAFHRFLIANGYLIELSVLVHNRGKLNEGGSEGLIEEAYSWMSKIENGLMPGKVIECK